MLVVSNCSPCRLAHSMHCAVSFSSFSMAWLMLLPDAIQLRSSTKENPSAEMNSSTHIISPQGYIAVRIGDSGEHCRTPASTWCLVMAFLSMIISTIVFERVLCIHHLRSRCIWLAFISLSIFLLATLGNAAVRSMKSKPVLSRFIYAAWSLSIIVAAASMARDPLLLPHRRSLSSPLGLASSDNSSATTSSLNIWMQLSSEISWY